MAIKWVILTLSEKSPESGTAVIDQTGACGVGFGKGSITLPRG